MSFDHKSVKITLWLCGAPANVSFWCLVFWMNRVVEDEMSQNLLKSVTLGNCAFNNLYYLKVNFWERNFSITRSMSSQELCTLPVNFWLMYEPTLFNRVTFNDICVLRCKNCDLPGPLTKKINICTNNNPSPKMQRGFYSTNINHHDL